MASTSGMSLSSCCASVAPAGALPAAAVTRPFLIFSRLPALDATGGGGALWQKSPLHSHHGWNPLGIAKRGRAAYQARAHLGHLPNSENVQAAVGLLSQVPDSLQHAITRAESLLYTLADATVAADAVVQKDDGGWLGGLTNTLESILKFLKDGLSTLHIPYSYGFAIILLTILVKAATYPLTKQQVESTLAMQNLQPKLKAIQQRYAGDQERIQLETARLYKQAGVNPLAGCLPTLATLPVWIGLYRALSNVANEGLLTEGFFWIPSLAGPTTLLSRQSGSGISWLFPFVDGEPPLGWPETVAYLVLPVLLVASQFISMQLMQPPQTDPSQKNTQVILKFLPLMIGYFSLSVPSGLSLYWFTNNLLSTAQQVWLRNLGGAKPIVGKDGAGIISAGQAKRSSVSMLAAPATDVKEERREERREEKRGEKFKRLKEEENKKKAEKARLAAQEASKAGAKAAAEERERVARAAAVESGSDVRSSEEEDSQQEEEEEEAEEEEEDAGGVEDAAVAQGQQVFAGSGNGSAASESSSSSSPSSSPSQKKGKRSKRKRAV